MPVYEFLCEKCQIVFNFHTTKVDTKTNPCCPHCSSHDMKKQFSTFSNPNGQGGDKDCELEEEKLANAFGRFLEKTEGISGDDSSGLMQALGSMVKESGMNFNESTQAAIDELVQGADPDSIGGKIKNDLADGGFSLEQMSLHINRAGKNYKYDEKLYELDEYTK